MPSKAELRRALRAQRRAIASTARRRAAHALLRFARRARLFAPGRRIGFYMPAKGEIDCLPMLTFARTQGATVHLPVVPAGRLRKLRFTAVGDSAYWRSNRFGIAEYGHHLPRKRALEMDVLFLPLLGFDAYGHRLGMGGGFYDATLAHLARPRVWRRPRLIGLAFAVQACERLPADPWDVRLDAVLTEHGLTRFRSTPKQQ